MTLVLEREPLPLALHSQKRGLRFALDCLCLSPIRRQSAEQYKERKRTESDTEEISRVSMKNLPIHEAITANFWNFMRAMFAFFFLVVPLSWLLVKRFPSLSDVVSIGELLGIFFIVGVYAYKKMRLKDRLYRVQWHMWEEVSMVDYGDPVPDRVMHKANLIADELPGVQFKVHKLKRDPLLEATYGDEREYIDCWDEEDFNLPK